MIQWLKRKLSQRRWKRQQKRLKQQRSNDARLLYTTVRDVVERARAGDQVAMAHLARVRDEAKAGNPTARQSLRIAEQYIDENPPTHFGFERPPKNDALESMQKLSSLPPAEGADLVLTRAPELSFNQLVTCLANGPEDLSLFGAVQEVIPDDVRRKSFVHGSSARSLRTMPSEAHPVYWTLGHAFGIAFAIQCIGRGDPLLVLCPVVAWELGE